VGVFKLNTFIINADSLAAIAKVDELKGVWHVLSTLAPKRLFLTKRTLLRIIIERGKPWLH
jgi:hypothetical protein